HKLRFALQLDGVNLAQGISTAPVTIPAQQQARVPVQVSVDGPSLLGLIATLPADGSVHYLLTGTAEIGQTLLQIPFRHSGVVRWGVQ
ncbi:MAG: LEA type 2 family protein, partial [Thiomonas sp.]